MYRRAAQSGYSSCGFLPDVDGSPDLTLPALDLRLVARRAALPLALAAAAAAVVLLAGGPLAGPRPTRSPARSRPTRAGSRVAAVAELLSFGGYIALFWLVGRRATPRLDLRASAEITLGGAAATRLLPTAGAGGAALTLWAIAKTGIGSRRAGRDAPHLPLAPLRRLPRRASRSPARRSRSASAGAHGHAARRRRSPRSPPPLAIVDRAPSLGLRGDDGASDAGPDRARRGAPRRGRARRARASLRRGDARLLGAPAWWAFDAAVLWATFHALGEPPALAVLAFAYFAGQVGNTIPIPGAVSGGMVGDAARLRRRARSRALLRARLPRRRDLAARPARPRRARRAARPRRALGARGRRGRRARRGRSSPGPAPSRRCVSGAVMPCACAGSA